MEHSELSRPRRSSHMGKDNVSKMASTNQMSCDEWITNIFLSVRKRLLKLEQNRITKFIYYQQQTSSPP